MKFRRKARTEGETSESGSTSAEEAGSSDADQETTYDGPWDADDDDLPPVPGVERIDLGSLLVAPTEGRELRLQVDEATQQVQAVMLAGPDGMLELRAFAAPRGGDLWADVRRQIAAEVAQQGGTADEREGRFGTELACRVTVRTPEGQTATQPSRVIGVNGPRWLLRATLLGRPAIEPEGSQSWEEAVASVAVRRGAGAMMAGEALPVTLPSGARRMS